MDNLEALEERNELVVINNGKAEIAPLLAYELAMAEQRVKEIQDFQKRYKQKILEKMEELGIMKLDNDAITITYIAPTTAEKLDSKRLKEENPDLYNQYLKISDVASCIKIKCK